jgi:hypothetical protein
VSTNASASNAASLQVDTPVATEAAAANTASSTAAAARQEDLIESIGQMIKTSLILDYVKVNAASMP